VIVSFVSKMGSDHFGLATAPHRPFVFHFSGGNVYLKAWTIAIVGLASSLAIAADGGNGGVIRDIAQVKLQQDSDVKCLSYALETGNPETGPSTHILELPKGCRFPWHYHTAQEQMLIVDGTVLVEMASDKPASLGPAGFAMMPSREPHQFTCVSARKCKVFATFSAAYDIFWVKR
jgi:quercetin dioxygenase-like cupin family protein